MKIKPFCLYFLLFFLFIPNKSNTLGLFPLPFFVKIGGLCCFLSYCLFRNFRNDILLYACQKEKKHFIIFLKFFGADINQSVYTIDGNSSSVLKIALTKEKSFLDFLVQQGLQISPHNLWAAAQVNDVELIKKYLQYGVDATKAPSAMNEACFFGNKEMIEILQKAGVDIRVSSVYYACKSIEGVRILDYLQSQGAPIDELEQIYLYTVLPKLRTYKEAEKIEIIETIINSRILECFVNKYCNKSELFGSFIFDIPKIAQFKTNCDELLFLLLNIKDEEKKYGLLQKLCTHKIMQYIFLCYGSNDDNTELIKLLLKKDKNFFDLDLMQTSFFDNCEAGNLHMVTSMLSDDRIDLNIKSKGLSLAIKKKRNDIALLLCNQEINLEYVDHNGNSLLHKAVYAPDDILCALLSQYTQPEKALQQLNNYHQTVLYCWIVMNGIVDTQHIFFKYCSDVQDFLYKELHYAGKLLKSSSVSSILDFCLKEKIDFNKRNKDKKRPIDIAIEEYQKVASDGYQNCSYFANKEKIMHAFMNHTYRITENELGERLRSYVCEDIVKKIMYYYHHLSVDYFVAQKLLLTKDMGYYFKTKQKKQLFKNCLVATVHNQMFPKSLSSRS